MIVQGSQVQRDIHLRAEIVVIGSGAGGAVVAKELAEAGHDVLVLEEGPYVPPTQYGMWRPSQSLRKLGRSGGTTVAVGLGDSPTINILAGSCVGGSSVMTGGVCFRIPEHVHHEWSTQLGTPGLSLEAMRPFYERVEQYIHTQETPVHLQSRATSLFGQGMRQMQHALKPIARNVTDCKGASRCNFGCPSQAKMAVDQTYLPLARQAGAKLYADMRVERILQRSGRAVGVEGVTLRAPDRKASHRFTVKADHVVLAAGTLHTPMLLWQSRIAKGNKHLGRHMTLHPSFRVSAYFDETIEVWKGAMQSAYSFHNEDPKLIFISATPPTSVLTGTIHGVGPAYMKEVREQTKHIATFGAMVHDHGGGRVRRGLGREPILTYRMAPEDKASVFRGIRFMARSYFHAGARKVTLPVIGHRPLRHIEEVDALNASSIRATQLECLSFHPLGTCRMAQGRDEGVVDTQGRSFALPNLWIADGSVFRSSVGVNTQIPVMTMATRTAFHMLDAI